MKKLNSDTFKKWHTECNSAKAPDGVCVLDTTKFPGGMRIVVAINDCDEGSSRAVMRTIDDIVGHPKSGVSLAISNDSLVPWAVGINGKCECGQIWFRDDVGINKDFTVSGQCAPNASHQVTLENCQELVVDFAVDKIKTSNKNSITNINGFVDVTLPFDGAYFQQSSYKISLKGK